MKNYLLTLFFLYSIELLGQSNNFPRYLIQNKDTIGILFSMKQCNEILNDKKKLVLYKNLKTSSDSLLQKYWVLTTKLEDNESKYTSLIELYKKNDKENQTLFMTKEELEKNPKTQMYEVVKKTTVRKGKYPFILQTLRTEQEGKTKEIWTEVETGKVKYQVTNFGKKTKIKLVLKKNVKFVYKLSDTPSKRHSQIHKRILAEKKKKKTTRS